MDSPSEVPVLAKSLSNLSTAPKPAEKTPPPPPALKAKILDELADIGGRSTVHGFPSLSSPGVHVTVKVIWLCCVLAGWSYLGVQIYKLFAAYTSYEVQSTISTAFEIPTMFPAVDICNLAPYNADVVSDQIAAVLSEKNIDHVSGQPLAVYTDYASLQYKSSFEATTGMDLYSSGFKLSEMLLSCMYQGEQCSSADFTYYHDFSYGSCYRFNGGEQAVRQSSKPGWRNGLRVELFLGPEQQSQYVYKRGLRVAVHNQSITPFLDDAGIEAAVGMQTNVALSRTFIYRLPEPYSGCVGDLDDQAAQKSAPIAAMLVNQLSVYDQDYCLKICVQRLLIANCSCYDASLKSLNLTDYTTLPICSSLAQVDCLKAYKIAYANNAQLVSACNDQCPQACNEVVYASSVRVATYPTDWYTNLVNSSENQFDVLDLLGREPDFEFMSRNTLMLNVFYEALEYTIIAESPAMESSDLLGNLGGNLGLFTGSGLLSFVELLEVLIAVTLVVYHHRRKSDDN